MLVFKTKMPNYKNTHIQQRNNIQSFVEDEKNIRCLLASDSIVGVHVIQRAS